MDVKEVLSRVKRHMLKHGEHKPLVFVVTDDAEYCLPVDGTQKWDTHDERVETLFIMGRIFAQMQSVGIESVSALFFVQEFWFVCRTPGEPMPERPSMEPDRKEVLGVIELRIHQEQKEMEQSFYQSEILRHGDIIDLAPHLKAEQAKSTLLTCFLAGIGSATYDDKEFVKIVRRFSETGEI